VREKKRFLVRVAAFVWQKAFPFELVANGRLLRKQKSVRGLSVCRTRRRLELKRDEPKIVREREREREIERKRRANS
jgi:hypothetical protein